VNRLLASFRHLYSEMLKFGVVGTIGVASDIAASNLLWATTSLSPTEGSVGGTCVATVVAYIGNRYWVFRDRPDNARRREMLLFLVISLIGLVIESSFVFFGDRVLGFHSQQAANVEKYIFGLPIAGVFRFWSAHVFVFPERGYGDRGEGEDSEAEGDSRPEGAAEGVPGQSTGEASDASSAEESLIS
jgi:putative flippase GtrA